MTQEETKTSAQRLGGMLKQLRESRGVSMIELASKTGRDRAQLYKIESGDNAPTVKVLDELLAPLGCMVGIVNRSDGQLPPELASVTDRASMSAEQMVRLVATALGVDISSMK